MNTKDPVGFVSWCFTPPVGVSEALHKFSILDSIDMASKFLEASEGHKREQEKLVVGSAWIACLLRLPQVRLEVDRMFLEYGGVSRLIVEDKNVKPMSATLYGLGDLRVSMLIVPAYPPENQHSPVAREPALIH